MDLPQGTRLTNYVICCCRSHKSVWSQLVFAGSHTTPPTILMWHLWLVELTVTMEMFTPITNIMLAMSIGWFGVTLCLPQWFLVLRFLGRGGGNHYNKVGKGGFSLVYGKPTSFTLKTMMHLHLFSNILSVNQICFGYNSYHSWSAWFQVDNLFIRIFRNVKRGSYFRNQSCSRRTLKLLLYGASKACVRCCFDAFNETENLKAASNLLCLRFH